MPILSVGGAKGGVALDMVNTQGAERFSVQGIGEILVG